MGPTSLSLSLWSAFDPSLRPVVVGDEVKECQEHDTMKLSGVNDLPSICNWRRSQGMPKGSSENEFLPLLAVCLRNPMNNPTFYCFPFLLLRSRSDEDRRTSLDFCLRSYLQPVKTSWTKTMTILPPILLRDYKSAPPIV